jgi:hypothetical protein
MNALRLMRDDAAFDDDYQRARRRRMLADRVTASPEPAKLGSDLVHDRHEGAGTPANDAQGKPPQPKPAGFEEPPRETLGRASEIITCAVTGLREVAPALSPRKSSRLVRAVTFLKQELAAGPTSAKVIYGRGAGAGLSERTRTGPSG